MGAARFGQPQGWPGQLEPDGLAVATSSRSLARFRVSLGFLLVPAGPLRDPITHVIVGLVSIRSQQEYHTRLPPGRRVVLGKKTVRLSVEVSAAQRAGLTPDTRGCTDASFILDRLEPRSNYITPLECQGVGDSRSCPRKFSGSWLLAIRPRQYETPHGKTDRDKREDTGDCGEE